MSLAPGQRALMYALSGVMRSDASRSNYALQRLSITIGGSARRIIHHSLTIHDYQHNTPNTAMLTVYDAKPVEGAVIVIANGAQRLFAGNIVRVTEAIAVQNPGNPRNILWHTEAIDWTWQLNQRLVTAKFLTASATSILWNLVTNWGPPGYVAAAQAGLPIIDEITFTNETLANACSRLAQRIGGYTKVDYFKNVLLWISEQEPPPTPITWDLRSFKSMTYARDLSQIVTRALVEGGGVNAIAPVAPGSTRIPVDTVVWYSPTGGWLVSGPQQIAYTGLVEGGGGAFVGSGITPTTAPTLTAGRGASAVEAGPHNYAYTWVTANGETLPSPASPIVVGLGVPGPAPLSVYTWVGVSGSWLEIGAIYTYAFCWSFVDSVTDTSQLSALSATVQQSCIGWQDQGGNWHACGMAISWKAPTPVPAGALRFVWWRLVGGTWYSIAAIPVGQAAQTYYDFYGDGQLVNSRPANPAPGGSVVQSQVTVAGLAPGPSGVTGRKVYRTAAGASQLKLLTTLANNTATALPAFDNTPDASLGANVPVVDTAGVVSQNKLVPAGSPDLLVTSTAPFAPSGGHVTAGQQVVRYAGTSATALTGIPTSGDGAITASIAYGTPVIAAAEIIGIPASGLGSIVWPIAQGDPVNVLIIVDDLPAQAALAALLGGGAIGVQESYQQDRRLSITEATAEAHALLARSKDPLVTLRYRTTDPATVSGALVTITLGAPVDVAGTFRIQDVQLSGFTADGKKGPNYDVVASSQRFTFEDLIRQLRK